MKRFLVLAFLSLMPTISNADSLDDLINTKQAALYRGSVAPDIEDIYYDAENGRIASAVKEITDLANSGNANAAYHLGIWNQYGKYVPIDLDKAVEWYALGASLNHQDSSLRLAGIYKDKSYKHGSMASEAASIYNRYKGKEVKAKTSLALMLLDGDGIAKDLIAGQKLLEEADLYGDIRATRLLAINYYLGDKLRKNDNKSLKYAIKAARKGDVDMYALIGKINLNGEAFGSRPSTGACILQDSINRGSDLGLTFYKPIEKQAKAKNKKLWQEMSRITNQCAASFQSVGIADVLDHYEYY